MVKSIVSALITLALFIFASVWEQAYLKQNFTEFKEEAVVLYEKIEAETACADEALSLQKFWIRKKESLHVFIPHTEIKEIDLWIAESVTLIKNEKFDDALSKIDVVIELVEQIPKTFGLRIENIL